ncbi:MAG: tol-pal system protein YbgF [Thermoanaerobaculia bacterium]
MSKWTILLLAATVLGCSTTAPPAEPRPEAVEPAVTDPRIDEMEGVISELLDRIDVLNARLQKLENEVSQQPSTPVVAVSAPPATGVAPRPSKKVRHLSGAELAAAYQDALAAFGKGSLAEAREKFQAVFDADPDGDLADNALYWIGETHYSEGHYDDAMKYYRRVIDDYSDQNKAPDAMLKMGLAYEKTGDLGMAGRTFRDLIQRYPYSTPASAARREVNRIKY